MSPEDVVLHLVQLGGVCRFADLAAVTGLRALRRALVAEAVHRDGHTVALPSLPTDRLQAAVAGAAVSHLSAAVRHGWPVLREPKCLHLVVGVGRNLPPRPGITYHWQPLTSHEQENGVTEPVRTVLDCARTLPFDEALAVADSALRCAAVAPGELIQAADELRWVRGAVQARRVAGCATRLAESVLESGLRAVALDAVGPLFHPQLEVTLDDGGTLHPDLADPDRRIALEADSFRHHGHRQALVADCTRYDELAASGWVVLRASWEHVMGQQEWLARMIRRTVAARERPAWAGLRFVHAA